MQESWTRFRLVLITVAGWMNQRQLQIIDYPREENRVLGEQLWMDAECDLRATSVVD